VESRPDGFQPAQATVDQAGQTPPEKKQSALLKVFNILGNTVFILLLLVMAAMIFTMVQSKLTGKPPAVAGHLMYIVLGGSMSPTFEAGSLAFVKPVDPQKLGVGDIITYRTSDDSDLMTTHRIMAVHQEDGGLSFTTRGDANDIDDDAPVLAGDIVGQVNFTVPYAGFLMDFAQTKKGLIALVFIPGALIIIFELRNLFRYAAEHEAEKRAREAAKQLEAEQTERPA
jgi:signal peptidase